MIFSDSLLCLYRIIYSFVLHIICSGNLVPTHMCNGVQRDNLSKAMTEMMEIIDLIPVL